MKLTLSQASDLTGITRNGLLKAIKRGKVSASRDDVRGLWLIDAAELSRVYPVKSDTKPEENETSPAVLSERIQQLEKMVSTLQNERDDLRRRLDQESAERRQLMAVLTHQVEPRQSVHKQPEDKGPLYRKLFGKS